MAGLCRCQSGAVTLLAAILVVALNALPAVAQTLYERPVLAVDPGMHTAVITSAAADAAAHFLVTGSHDKTVRVWSVSDGKLLNTIHVPAGPGDVGKIYAVAMSPDGNFVAVGGWTGEDKKHPIYIFERATGRMAWRLSGSLNNVTLRLTFSSDGRYLAAALGGTGGLRVFDRDSNWSEVFIDTEYGDHTYGVAFAHDGRLATASYDGKIRLYDRTFMHTVSPQSAPSGRLPRDIAFNPDGNLLALGYKDTAAVDLLDGHNLAPQPGPDINDLDGALVQVAWSPDGQVLFGAGTYPRDKPKLLLSWNRAGHGKRRTLSICGDSGDAVTSLVPLPAGELLIATDLQCLNRLGPDGSAVWIHRSPNADFRFQARSLAVSRDASIVDFEFGIYGEKPIRFDLRKLSLWSDPVSDDKIKRPKQNGIPIDDWLNSFSPKVNSNSIRLRPGDLSRSLAIDQAESRFVLGTSWTLQALDREGNSLWTRPVPGEAWAVNISSDGRLLVAAYGDGTIRWHRLDDGQELLNLQVLADRKNWVAWTPEGFYAATPGAYGVLRWIVNRGTEAAAESVPVSAIPKLKRPDALPLVLQELETARALGIADMAAARSDVQIATGSAQPPGARLHLLTIGLDEYGDKAKALHLKFAAKDAEDLATALINTQRGLYAEVVPQYLSDDKATRSGIFAAFAAMEQNMAKDPVGQDLAVVMFSGHGAIIDGHFYLLPYGLDATRPDQIEATAISADEFRQKVEKLSAHGRVLMLLDACHSGAVSDLEPDAGRLSSALVASNVTVLASSSAEETSREDLAWKNGAFTKVLIEALGRDADENHDGMISMTELANYLSRHLPELTGGRQHLGTEMRFLGDLFAASL